MNKKILLAISFLYLFSATAIAENSTNAAEGFSYDYIDTSFFGLDLSAPGRTNTITNYDGYSASISKTLSKNIHLLGAYMESEKNNGDALDLKSVGIGINYPINNSNDIVIDYLHERYFWTYVNASNIGGSFNSLEAKIRHQFTDDIELNAGLLRKDYAGSSQSLLYKGFRAGGSYRINNNLSLKFEMSKLNDSSSTTVDADITEFGLRYNF